MFAVFSLIMVGIFSIVAIGFLVAFLVKISDKRKGPALIDLGIMFAVFSVALLFAVGLVVPFYWFVITFISGIVIITCGVILNALPKPKYEQTDDKKEREIIDMGGDKS